MKNLIQINQKSNNDFTLIAMENNMLMERVMLEQFIEITTLEKEFIDDCLESAMIVLEKLEETEVEVSKKRNIIDRIFDALEALFGKFKEKIKILTDKNREWLKHNLVDINEKSISKLPEIEAFPIWERTDRDIISSLSNLSINIFNRTKVKYKEYVNVEDIEELVHGIIGGKNDLATDAKNYFRTGKKGTTPELIKVKGTDISKHTSEMYNYVVKYDTIVVPQINKMMNTFKNKIKSFNNTTVVEESFSMLENLPYSKTELGYLPIFESIVMEETKDDNTNTENDDKKPKNLTSVKVIKNNEEDDNDGKSTSNKHTDNETIEYIKSLTSVIKIIQGAVLTVLEEKYVTYINIFKATIEYNKSKKSSSEEKK